MMTLLNYLPFGILMLTYFARNAEGYCKFTTSINTKNSLLKITKIEPHFIKSNVEDCYIETWNEGEVSWDLPESSIEIYNSGKALQLCDKNAYDNSIFEKYFKNRLYLRVRPSYIKQVYSSFIKYAYKDIIKFETIAGDIQDLAFNSRGTSVESDLILLLLASGLGVLYNNNKAESIETLTLLRQSAIPERLKSYKEIKRYTGIVFVAIMTIFWRNVKNAE
jgi:hypothetical protein